MNALGARRALHAVMLCATGVLLNGCAIGPRYEVPTATVPAGYKEAPGWTAAQPADAVDRGPWWSAFGDAELDALMARVDVSNQNIAAATAAYAQARALVREQRAALFPSVVLNGDGSRSGGSGRQNASGSATNYQVALGVAWEPDVWGRLRAATEASSASAQASEADLASARLSAQGELAANYFSLRQVDAQKALVDATVTGYEQSLRIARNRYEAGIAPRSDVLQAETQLANARADALGLAQTRAQLEHAIAVLVGVPPSELSLTQQPWRPTVPDIPPEMPSELLQRRPDIAAAERRVASANEQIGIARSAYFPSLSLSGSRGVTASRASELFGASSSLWSLGISAAQTLFDAGQTSARVEGARAAHDEAVARYRQSVLQAFQDVKDQLAAIRVLAAQQAQREQASRAADEAEQQVLNRYRAGQVSYAEVISAQATALSSRRALAQLIGDRQVAAVALVQALGGGWSGLMATR
ncbi:MAG: efflux transporter outer membrane subunit [Rubrivivax sp.]|nr:MAG: efflux transporter outer membrane subunit [Rubrivivax sp.]